MGKEILTFVYIEIERKKITAVRLQFFLKDVDIEKVLVSKKISFGEKNYKYFIGYLYNGNKVKPWYIMLQKTSAYVSYDGQAKWMYFLIEDDDFLEKYNSIWDKMSADVRK